MGGEEEESPLSAFLCKSVTVCFQLLAKSPHKFASVWAPCCVLCKFCFLDMRSGNWHQILTINLSVTYLPVFMPQLLPINQLFSPLVLLESLAQLLAPYLQSTVTPFHVLCCSLSCSRWQGREGQGRALWDAVPCPGDSFVLVSFMAETGWWLPGHGSKLISCLSFFFLGLKSFPVHSSVCCEV